jgi:tRNA(fMet)-specific endonuclease VapC
MRYLVDTNTCIHAMRGVPSVIRAMSACAPGDIAISSITCYELFVGVEKCADTSRERTKVDVLIGALQHVLFDLSSASCAASIRAGLEARGEMIGPYDILIAGHAQSLGLILVTANTKEFARVPALILESWQ